MEKVRNNHLRRLLPISLMSSFVLVAAGCAAPAEQPKAPKKCGIVINKASFTYTEYDVARLFWDGQSQQKTVVDYKLATSDGRVVTLNKNQYIAAKKGDRNCEGDFGQWNEETPTPSPAADCDVVTQAEVLTEGGIAGSNLFLDGELRSKISYYPLLTTDKIGSVVVDQDKYVLHPVGSTVCFDAQELKKY